MGPFSEVSVNKQKRELRERGGGGERHLHTYNTLLQKPFTRLVSYRFNYTDKVTSYMQWSPYQFNERNGCCNGGTVGIGQENLNEEHAIQYWVHLCCCVQR